MKNYNLNDFKIDLNSTAPIQFLDSFLASQYYVYLLWGAVGILFTLILITLYLKLYFFKYASIDKINNLKKNNLARKAIGLLFFLSFLSIILIIYYLTSFFSETAVLCFFSGVIAILGIYILYSIKKFKIN